MSDFIKALKALIEEFAPTLAVLLWNYEEAKVDEVKNEVRKANVQLEMEFNHETVDKENSGKSDADIINSAINSEQSGNGQSGKGDQGS
jgi:phage I-like protein